MTRRRQTLMKTPTSSNKLKRNNAHFSLTELPDMKVGILKNSARDPARNGRPRESIIKLRPLEQPTVEGLPEAENAESESLSIEELFSCKSQPENPVSQFTPLNLPAQEDDRVAFRFLDSIRSKQTRKSPRPPISSGLQTSQVKEEKNYKYYMNLENVMEFDRNESVWNYVFTTHSAEEKNEVLEKTGRSKIALNTSQAFLQKASQMIFTKVLAERKTKLGLSNLKISDNQSSAPESVKTKAVAVGGQKAFNILFDNLSQTGADSILSYIDKAAEPLEDTANILQGVTTLISRTVGKINSLPGDSSSNLEQNLNMRKFLDSEKQKSKAYEYSAKRSQQIEKFYCRTETFRLKRSNFHHFFCAQYFRLEGYMEDALVGRDPKDWNCIQTDKFVERADIPGRKSQIFATDQPTSQRILVSKFSPDGYSLALGCSDGNVVVMQYNNEKSKVDFFQEKSLVLKRHYSEENAVLDLAWALVSWVHRRTRKPCWCATLTNA